MWKAADKTAAHERDQQERHLHLYSLLVPDKPLPGHPVQAATLLNSRQMQFCENRRGGQIEKKISSDCCFVGSSSWDSSQTSGGGFRGRRCWGRTDGSEYEQRRKIRQYGLYPLVWTVVVLEQ